METDLGACMCVRFCDSSGLILGARGGLVVKALHYKQEGRGFDS